MFNGTGTSAIIFSLNEYPLVIQCSREYRMVLIGYKRVGNR